VVGGGGAAAGKQGKISAKKKNKKKQKKKKTKNFRIRRVSDEYKQVIGGQGGRREVECF